MKNVYKKFVLFGVVFAILLSNFHNVIGITEVFATAGNTQTIQMGDNAPMTRNEFMEWSIHRGIRHFSIDGRIYPAGIFFGWANGQSFSYGELSGGILHVVLRPTPAIENNDTSAQGEMPYINENTQEVGNSSPDIFTCLTPTLFSYDEMTEMIENALHMEPLDIRSAITLPNRRLTESELELWISEYRDLGSATAFELAVVQEVNRVRVQYGLYPLALDPSLMMSARLKTQEFADLQYFGHYSPIHGSPTEAARMFGFEGSHVAEAITQSGSSGAAVFRTTPERIVGGVLASTRGHREILLNPNARSIGFGAYFSPYSTGRNGDMSHMFYFATNFGFAD